MSVKQAISRLENDGYKVVKDLHNVVRLKKDNTTKIVLLLNNKVIINTYNI